MKLRNDREPSCCRPRGRQPRAQILATVRLAALGSMLGAGLGACGFSVPSRPHCVRGSQPVDGQCIPTATIVFRQCVETFRRESVAHDRGHGVSVGGNAKGYGGAHVEHQTRDVEHTQFTAVAAERPEVIIDECRRQEEVERQRQLALAWDAADAATERAEHATRDADELRETLAAQDAAVAAAEGERDSLREELEASGEAFAALRASLAEFRPCLAEQWSACAQAARDDHQAGDYPQAHRRYELACAAGQTEACGEWGLLFEHGLGVSPQLERGLALYEQACEADDQAACVRWVLASGSGTRTSKRGQRLLRDACGAGEGRGCTALASALESSPEASEPAASSRITRLYAQGCDLDDASGCVSLGLRHEAGIEVPRDLAEARRLHAKACDLGDEDGCVAEARIGRLAQGNPTRPDR